MAKSSYRATCEEYPKIRGVYGIEKGLRPDDDLII